MSFIATKKFRIAALAVGLLFVGVVAAQVAFNGTVTSPVTITSTATAANLAITSATANGVACTIYSPTTATCNGVTIGQGGSYGISVIVTNSGGTADPTVTASPNTPSLGTITPGGSSQSIAANGGTGSWTFTYTAGQTTGTDSAVITITG